MPSEAPAAAAPAGRRSRWAANRWLLARLAAGLAIIVAASSLARPRPAWVDWGVSALTIAVVLDAYLSRRLRRGQTVAEALADLGLGRAGAAAHTALGFALGALMISAVVACLAAAGWYRVRSVNPSWTLAGGVGGFLFVGFVEELIFRGLVFRVLEAKAGSWTALGVTALLFGLAHLANPHSGLVAAAAIALEAGVLLAAAYMAWRTLWVPIGIHWAWNLFEGPVYGTPVSGITPPQPLLRAAVRGPELWTGGSFGPEAGMVTMLAGLVLGGALLALAARRGQVLTPNLRRKALAQPARS